MPVILRYPEELVPGKLIRRYKRFLADVVLPDGREAVAHCGNPGSMTGLAEPGSAIWLSANRNPTAKLDWRWEITTQSTPEGMSLVGINTALANRVVETAIQAGQIRELADYSSLRREVRYGSRKSRIDFLLEEAERTPCYVEVKSVTLRRPDGPDPQAAQFPDAKTERGAKHLAELSDVVRGRISSDGVSSNGGDGARAVMLYLVQRNDCHHVSLATDIDPAYAAAFAAARDAGVEAICYDCNVTPQGIELKSSLPLIV